MVKAYMKGSKTDASLPEIVTIEDTELGKVDSSRAVIIMEPDRQVSYKLYKKVQNELVAAFKELRDETSLKYFNQNYEALREEQQEISPVLMTLLTDSMVPRCVEEERDQLSEKIEQIVGRSLN